MEILRRINRFLDWAAPTVLVLLVCGAVICILGILGANRDLRREIAALKAKGTVVQQLPPEDIEHYVDSAGNLSELRKGVAALGVVQDQYWYPQPVNSIGDYNVLALDQEGTIYAKFRTKERAALIRDLAAACHP